MTFTIPQLLQLFITFCGAVVTIAAAAAVFYKIYQASKKPDTERDEAIKRHAELLNNDNRRLRELEDSNKIILKSLLAIMSHELDGNHTDELEKRQAEIKEFLIDR